MIRITVELVSAISPERSRLLGVGIIANDGQGTAGIGNYNATFSKGEPYVGKADATALRGACAIASKHTWHKGRVGNFNKVQFGAWDLLWLCLSSAIGPARGKRVLQFTADRRNEVQG
jgi:hypothetical protein